MAVRHEWQPDQPVLGDFVVEDRLGAGGKGIVYRLRSRSTGQRFAGLPSASKGQEVDAGRDAGRLGQGKDWKMWTNH